MSWFQSGNLCIWCGVRMSLRFNFCFVFCRHIRTMMAPFVMRRLKVDVLGQLPAKQVVAKLLRECSFAPILVYGLST